MPPSVSIRVGGTDFGGWQTARVTRSIESACGSFSLGVVDRWSEDASWPVAEGDECAVSIDGAPVITGFVDARNPSYSDSECGVEISGRDRARNLVDCSAYVGWQFKNTTPLQLAQKLCAPFQIPVSVQSGLTFAPVARYGITPGDTSFNTLEKACRLAGVLVVSDGLGGIVLTRAGTDRYKTTALVEGENIKRASARYDHSQRFYRYVVLGQHAASEESWGEAVTHVKAEAFDSGVSDTSRVLVVRPEGNTTVQLAKNRAQWEASVRAARSATVNVTVQGWTEAGGELWEPNKLVYVKSPRIGVDGELLIASVTYALSSTEGTTTDLVLRRPKAFFPEPTISNAADGLWKEISRGV